MNSKEKKKRLNYFFMNRAFVHITVGIEEQSYYGSIDMLKHNKVYFWDIDNKDLIFKVKDIEDIHPIDPYTLKPVLKTRTKLLGITQHKGAEL